MGRLSISRQGQAFAKIEASFGVSETLAASNAIRHMSIALDVDNFNRENVNEKKVSPGASLANRATRRKSADWSLEALLRMGGVVNTAPELDPILVAGFGQKTSRVLATTVASGGTLTGATLTSAGTLAVGDPVLITCPDGRKRVRFLATVVGNVVTWSDALPSGQVPANGAAVKGSIRYHLTTALSSSLTIAHYLLKTDQSAGLAREAIGAVVDKLSITLDANAEPMIAASGMAKAVNVAQTKPGAFTTIGSLPPSGLIGEMLVGGVAMPFLKFKADIDNAMGLRKDEYGYAEATEAYRAGRRAVALSLSAHVDDEATLYTPTRNGSYPALFVQGGDTEGNIFAIRVPNADLKVPKTSDGDNEADWDYTGMALETTDGANDEIALAIF
jgi:hypothetical protein